MHGHRSCLIRHLVHVSACALCHVAAAAGRIATAAPPHPTAALPQFARHHGNGRSAHHLQGGHRLCRQGAAAHLRGHRRAAEARRSAREGTWPGSVSRWRLARAYAACAQITHTALCHTDAYTLDGAHFVHAIGARRLWRGVLCHSRCCARPRPGGPLPVRAGPRGSGHCGERGRRRDDREAGRPRRAVLPGACSCCLAPAQRCTRPHTDAPTPARRRTALTWRRSRASSARIRRRTCARLCAPGQAAVS